MAPGRAAPAWGDTRLTTVPSPAQQHHNGVDGDDGDTEEQAGDEDNRVIPWVGHQDIGCHGLTEGQVAIDPCGEGGWQEPLGKGLLCWRQGRRSLEEDGRAPGPGDPWGKEKVKGSSCRCYQ